MRGSKRGEGADDGRGGIFEGFLHFFLLKTVKE
jgi:hypothetical protein